jgi:plastocyanin
MLRTRTWIFAITTLLTTVGIGTSSTSFAADSKSATTVEVKIDNFSFLPAVITVPAGTTVRWTNRDDIPHTVVSDDHTTFKSKPLDTDEQFTYTFTKPGTYSYFCSIHPKMTGKVVVQ